MHVRDRYGGLLRRNHARLVPSRRNDFSLPGPSRLWPRCGVQDVVRRRCGLRVRLLLPAWQLHGEETDRNDLRGGNPVRERSLLLVDTARLRRMRFEPRLQSNDERMRRFNRDNASVRCVLEFGAVLDRPLGLDLRVGSMRVHQQQRMRCARGVLRHHRRQRRYRAGMHLRIGRGVPDRADLHGQDHGGRVQDRPGEAMHPGNGLRERELHGGTVRQARPLDAVRHERAVPNQLLRHQ